jgi:4-hydroxy-L-threonine phosphate dehydrogenase PdxA
VGPELLLRLLAREHAAGSGGAGSERPFKTVVVAERAVLERYGALVTGRGIDDRVEIVDPVGLSRSVEPGRPSRADAEGAMAALEGAVALMNEGAGDALVTLPVNKAEIARHVDPAFRGHTEWLAARAGLDRYGRDYLMTFLAEDLQVALLSTHVSLRDAITGVTTDGIAAPEAASPSPV